MPKVEIGESQKIALAKSRYYGVFRSHASFPNFRALHYGPLSMSGRVTFTLLSPWGAAL